MRNNSVHAGRHGTWVLGPLARVPFRGLNPKPYTLFRVLRDSGLKRGAGLTVEGREGRRIHGGGFTENA